MVSTSLKVSKAVESPIELPRDMAASRISELAQAYILQGPASISDADLYLANKSLLDRMSSAGDMGLTPRDVILSLLRPVLSSGEHCRCASCQSRCLVCKRAAEGVSEKAPLTPGQP